MTIYVLQTIILSVRTPHEKLFVFLIFWKYNKDVQEPMIKMKMAILLQVAVSKSVIANCHYSHREGCKFGVAFVAKGIFG